MLRTTRWRPDVCDCELEFQWDDKQDLASRTFSLFKSKVCAIHKALGLDGDVLLNVCFDECRKKGKALTIVADTIQAISVEAVTDDGAATYRRFKAGLAPDFSFDAARNLTIALPREVTPQDKSAADVELQKIGVASELKP